jgi:hypothetical protein
MNFVLKVAAIALVLSAGVQARANVETCVRLARQRNLRASDFAPGRLIFYTCSSKAFTSKTSKIVKPVVCLSDAETGWTSILDSANDIATDSNGGGGYHSTNISQESFKRFRVDAYPSTGPTNKKLSIEFGREHLFGYSTLARVEMDCEVVDMASVL